MKLEIATTPGGVRAKWLKRAGLSSALFFLVKGLLWVLVPVLLGWFGRG